MRVGTLRTSSLSLNLHITLILMNAMFSQEAAQSVEVDPKPGDLSMSRMKPL